MVYCIALTGNLASGKSTVAKLFANYGIKIINADEHAKQITAKGQPALQEITRHFGPEVVNPDNTLNRKHLRELIFRKPEERIWLEQLLHPLIRRAIEKEVTQCDTPYCIIEIPLLKDKADYPYLNRVLVVIASEETQIQRVMQRDHCSREHAIAILATQPSEADRLRIADDVIFNNDDIKTLEKEVANLHQRYLTQKLRGQVF